MKTQKSLSLIKAEKTFITSRQAIYKSNISYLDIFENIYNVYTSSGGGVAGPGMVAYQIERPGSSHAAGTDFNSLSIAEQDAVREQSRLAYISTLYVENANQ